eukprot:3531064-Rhodomonas_salina.6
MSVPGHALCKYWTSRTAYAMSVPDIAYCVQRTSVPDIASADQTDLVEALVEIELLLSRDLQLRDQRQYARSQYKAYQQRH